MSIARRLLRSIYDAASRASASLSTEGGEPDAELSLLYLEAFVALLEKFNSLQLVHNLREVVTIWLVSATYLAPGGEGPKSLDFQRFSREVSAHALLVLQVAAKYDLVDLSIVDSDLLTILLTQALAAAEKKEATVQVFNTVEFALQVIHSLNVVLKKSCQFINASLQSLKKFEGLMESDTDEALPEMPLATYSTLKAALLEQGVNPTLRQALTFVLQNLPS